MAAWLGLLTAETWQKEVELDCKGQGASYILQRHTPVTYFSTRSQNCPRWYPQWALSAGYMSLLEHFISGS